MSLKKYSYITNTNINLNSSLIKNLTYDKIFVIGFNKTATSSFHKLFIVNDLSSQHGGTWNLNSHVCFSDNPEKNNFKECYKKYPNSLFILNTRPTFDWIKSRINHVKYFKDMWAINPTNKKISFWINQRNQHHLDILNFFKDKKEKLLIIDINHKNWQNFLCKYLKIDISNVDINKNLSKVTKNESIKTHNFVENYIKKFNIKLNYLLHSDIKIENKLLKLYKSNINIIEYFLNYDKIFVIGFNKTATSSFHQLFIDNNISSQHADGNKFSQKWKLKKYTAFSDNAEQDYNNFKLCYEKYPNSLFILNVRPTDKWLKSRMNHGKVYTQQLWAAICDKKRLNEWIEKRNWYHNEILEYFKNKTNNLIIVDVNNENWQLFLGSFLNLSNINNEKVHHTVNDLKLTDKDLKNTDNLVNKTLKDNFILTKNKIKNKQYLTIYKNNIV